MARGRRTREASSTNRGRRSSSGLASWKCVEQVAREATRSYQHQTSPETSSSIKILMENARREWEEQFLDLVDKDEEMWHPLSIAPHTRYTRYCIEVEVHWITRLFMAQGMKHNDEKLAVLLTEISKLKEYVDPIKEVIHHLGHEFSMYLFPIPANDLVADPPSTSHQHGPTSTSKAIQPTYHPTCSRYPSSLFGIHECRR